jgi:hypothetical protein
MRTTVVIGLAFCAVSSLNAQVCREGETIKDCLSRVASPQMFGQSIVRELSAANSGVCSLGTQPGAVATRRDFVSKLIAAFEAAQNDQPITLDYDMSVGLRRVIKFEAVFKRPGLASDVTASLGENATALETLKQSLTYADDITASVSYSTRDYGAQLVVCGLNTWH